MTTREEFKIAGALLDVAEAKIATGADAVPQLLEALETVRGVLGRWGVLSDREQCMREGASVLFARISALASKMPEADAIMACEKALELAQEIRCDGCRVYESKIIMEEFLKAVPDPDARLRLGERLLARADEFERRNAERRRREFIEAVESGCNAITEISTILEGVPSRFERIRERLDPMRSAKERGEFQKPDFAKKPTPQPPEEQRMKRGS